jgi:hypothetical protein
MGADHFQLWLWLLGLTFCARRGAQLLVALGPRTFLKGLAEVARTVSNWRRGRGGGSQPGLACPTHPPALGARSSPIVAATIRAEAYLVPDLRPFLAPDEGPRADDAKLAGQVALLAHLRQGCILHLRIPHPARFRKLEVARVIRAPATEWINDEKLASGARQSAYVFPERA